MPEFELTLRGLLQCNLNSLDHLQTVLAERGDFGTGVADFHGALFVVAGAFEYVTHLPGPLFVAA